ncbi:DUF1804 family protein [Rhizobium cremeum]|uniref:DUF1804 family protein n=1 Tax=Rhizobium cremeum TaxID=2813827 RepID=UPI001FD10887|nr:DUF1804 family protein [Rhizobium cremeum]MCJ7996078.1 DUF1804 family protein [Rhizobium cremeum]MCJ8001337.1 DUF1804 family protein [Rhizobium cremeum]
MASDAETRRKARSDYVYRRMSMATIALTHNVSQATIGRWKKASKEAGDDWDMARSAATIAGEGLDVVVSSVTEDFVLLAQALLDEVKNNAGLTLDQKIKHMVALGDAMVKVTASAGKLAPKISELGVAQSVVQHLIAFVQAQFPQHISVVQEILVPFGDRIATAFAP